MTKPSSKEWLAKTATQRNHPAITNSAAEKKIDQEEPKSEVHSELNPPRKKRLDCKRSINPSNSSGCQAR